jgi:S-disulfanyl-L-cysteine oxidoreductase SoxD
VTLASSLPEYARDAHGDLAEQNRKIGAVRGQHTGGDGDAVATVNPGVALMKSQGCSGCHGIGNGIVGPAFRDVAKRYKNDKDAESRLVGHVKNGSGGNWGDIAMPAQAQVSDADVTALIRWILSGSPEN